MMVKLSDIKTSLKNFLFGFFSKKIYVDFLERALENQKCDETRYANDYLLILRDRLKNDFKYTDFELDAAKRYLIGAGYIGQHAGKLYVTEDGKLFFRDYNRFMLLGWFGKITAIGNKNFTFCFSLIALIISAIGLFHSFGDKLHDSNKLKMKTPYIELRVDSLG